MSGRWWAFSLLLSGCNAILGIEQHYQQATHGGEAGVESGGAGGAGASTGGQAGSPFVAFWRFESLTNGLAASTEPAPSLAVEQGKLEPGPSGSYLVFSGTGSAVASAPVIDAAGSFSVSVWIRLDEFDAWNTFVSQDGASISAFYLQKRDTNRLGFTTYDVDDPVAQSCIIESDLQPRRGEWYHVVATREATTGEHRIYVDGMLSGRGVCSGGFTSQGALVVGRGKWLMPTDFTKGAVDDLGIAARALDPEEIIDLYRRGRPAARHYLFAYFQEANQGRGDGLRFAHSHDGLTWGAIGAGRPFLLPVVGGKSFRDPHLMLDPSGTYHLVWTSSCVPWAQPDCIQDRGFAHATSRDLVTFSKQTLIEIPREELDVEHFWAPEVFYDAESQQYLLSWASPPDTTPNPDPHNIYYMLTKDFVSFGEPALLYSRAGRDFIDAALFRQGKSYVMFLKDEAEGQKNLRVVSSPTLFGNGAWTNDASPPLPSGDVVEGPAPLLQGDHVLLFYDQYAKGALGALRSRGLDSLADVGNWENVSELLFGSGIRHGSAVEVTGDVFRAVALKAAQ